MKGKSRPSPTHPMGKPKRFLLYKASVKTKIIDQSGSINSNEESRPFQFLFFNVFGVVNGEQVLGGVAARSRAVCFHLVENRLQDQISYHSFDTRLYRFNIPNLRVGTLDSLLALSDDLLKSNSFMDAVSHKIRRQIEELEKVSSGETTALTVDGVPVDSYLTRFAWGEAKYPTMSPLREIVDNIQGQVTKIEDDLKIRVDEYNNVRSQLNAINRKQIGSLAVRDLSNLVKPEDIVMSENLITLLAIVPKYSQKDWLCSYETLTNYVVPRCSKKLYEDNEYALYTVTLFRRVADNFRTSARERGFHIRDFEYSPEVQEGRKQELGKLMRDQENFRSSLLQWCYASYGEVFSSWMHFCAVRVFAESILRYGFPPTFLACALAPSTKGEKKVLSILEGVCDTANSLYWRSEDDAGGMAGLGGDAETHPYVSLEMAAKLAVVAVRRLMWHRGNLLGQKKNLPSS